MNIVNNKLLSLACFLCLSGCDNSEKSEFSGYIQGEFIYLSYNTTEKIENILVHKGDKVTKGQSLVRMDSFTAENALNIAEKNYHAESALLQDLESGERLEELNIVRSQLERARSAAKLAESQLGRYQQLYASLAISAAEWEKFKQDHVQKVAQVKELTHQLAAKELPARQAQINNQTLRAESSRFKWDKARWDLQQSLIVAPQDGRVYDVIYRPGERPLAGKPIISLLPPGNIKIRFFVAQKNLGALHIGQTIKASCDGCQQPIVGTINYISPQAEYTPPVIYSTARREKLVFMVEAVPMTEQADMIKIGQPVEVGVMADE